MILTYMPPLESQNLLFRELTASDLDGPYVSWMNETEITRFLESRFVEHTRDSLASYLDYIKKEKVAQYGIFLKSDNTHIGNIKLTPVDHSSYARFEIGILIGNRSQWGRGYGTEAVHAVTRHAFEKLKARKVTAGCYANNRNSLRIFEKSGFIREGVLRKHYLSDGHWVDKVLLAKFPDKVVTQTIEIGPYKIGTDHPPFVIAEMSGNHNQSLDQALKIVDAAAKAKVHALKLQTYTADTMTIDSKKPDFVIQDSKSLWAGNSLYQLYEKAHTPWKWHKIIFERCKALGLLVFSTPFDESAVDFLEELGVPAYKIASFENTDLRLIRKVAATQKPLIISTGMASLSELEEAVDTIRATGNEKIILLKCTSSYPASPENSHLMTLPHLKDYFRVEVGLSDHTLGTAASVASIALGATVIERHFVLNRAEGGVDAAFSLEPLEMSALVRDSMIAWQAQGKIQYGVTDSERDMLQFRRSLYVVKNVKAGEKLDSSNVRAIRPGHGLPVKFYEEVIGKAAKEDIERGTPVQWDLLV